MVVWNKEAIIKFHQCYEGEYAGYTVASEIIRLSRKHTKGKVLDIGAGSGALISRIPDSIGLDLVAKHPRIIVGDIASMPFNNESFDIIFATALLEHLDNITLK